MEAAVFCDRNNIAEILLLGNEKVIFQQLDHLGLTLGNITIIKPEQHNKRESYKETYRFVCDKKKLKDVQAIEFCNQPLIFANLLVKEGYADACVAGIKHATGDVIRAALRVIGTKTEKTRPSSFFIINSPVFPTSVIFADCAMNITPNAKQLAEIAYQSSRSLKVLLGLNEKIAMLSFSTKGSAHHKDVNKVVEATELLQKNHPTLNVIGEIQFDAAVSKIILKKKWPESTFEPPANIFIFPNLDAANMGYKIAEQMGKAKVIGPILQGLAKPVNDLSRGADIEAIINTIAVTCLQVDA